MDTEHRILIIIAVCAAVIASSLSTCAVLDGKTASATQVATERETTARMRTCVEHGHTYINGDCLGQGR